MKGGRQKYGRTERSTEEEEENSQHRGGKRRKEETPIFLLCNYLSLLLMTIETILKNECEREIVPRSLLFSFSLDR